MACLVERHGLAAHAKVHCREKSWYEDQRLFDKHLAVWHARRISTIIRTTFCLLKAVPRHCPVVIRAQCVDGEMAVCLAGTCPGRVAELPPNGVNGHDVVLGEATSERSRARLLTALSQCQGCYRLLRKSTTAPASKSISVAGSGACPTTKAYLR